MPQHPQRFWLAALIVAWAVDFLFWDKPIGVSFLIFITLATVTSFVLARSERVRPSAFSYVLGGLVIILAAFTFLRTEPMSRVLNALLALAGLALLVLTFTSGDWIRYTLLNYLQGFFDLMVAVFSRAFGMPIAPRTEQGSGGARALWRKSFPVLRGLLLAAPVVLVLGALLASADLVFNDQLTALFKNFNLDRVPEYIFRMIYILFLAYAFAGLYVYSVLPKSIFRSVALPAPAAEGTENGESLPAPANAAPAKKGLRILGFTESVIVLGSVNLLFAFFVAVQFRYFFGGQANITAAKYTFAEYARRGFFELVWVAILSLMLYLLLNAITRREKVTQERTFTGLAVLLVALVCVMLVSAFQRLLLYEDAYGFTSLRTYTHIFIPWLGFLLVGTIALQILRREQFFGALLLLSVFGFASSFGVINVDGLIVRQNVARAMNGAKLDVNYLVGLSDDSLPALVDEYQKSAGVEGIHNGLGAVLSCKAFRNFTPDKEPQHWQSYHFGQALGFQKLDSIDLQAYPVSNTPVGIYAKYGAQNLDCYLEVNRD